jgi:DNA-binding Lrp family transcriptional regulator
MVKKEEIVTLLKKEKALTLKDIQKRLGLNKNELTDSIKSLEKEREIIVFGKREGINAWTDIIAIANLQGFRDGTEKATHVPKTVKWKGWETAIYGLNTLSKRVDCLTASELIQWMGEDPKDPAFQLIAIRVMQEAGWAPLYNIFDRVVWLSPKLKQEIGEYLIM